MKKQFNYVLFIGLTPVILVLVLLSLLFFSDRGIVGGENTQYKDVKKEVEYIRDTVYIPCDKEHISTVKVVDKGGSEKIVVKTQVSNTDTNNLEIVESEYVE